MARRTKGRELVKLPSGSRRPSTPPERGAQRASDTTWTRLVTLRRVLGTSKDLWRQGVDIQDCRRDQQVTIAMEVKMSIATQPVPHTSSLISLNGSPRSPNEDGDVHDLDRRPSRVGASNSAVELRAVPGASAVLQLRQNGANPSNTTLASDLFEPVVSDASRSERVLLTHVFTDIVASTETLERVGDRVWCSLLLRHHNLVREHLKAYRGREIDAAGDGFFLVFDCPSRAIQFAVAVRTALKGIGIDLRIGIHTGECEVLCGRIEGVAVHTAARVANAATAGDILVSSTVRDLVAGSEHRFSKKDVRVFKGLSEPRQLFALDCPEGHAEVAP
jgi:class 3 adenylate cyclase